MIGRLRRWWRPPPPKFVEFTMVIDLLGDGEFIEAKLVTVPSWSKAEVKLPPGVTSILITVYNQ